MRTRTPIAALLALAFAGVGHSAHAADGQAAKTAARRDGAMVTPAPTAHPGATRPAAPAAVRHGADATDSRSSTADPYDVPLLRNAPSLR